MDLSRFKPKCNFGPMPNAVIAFETLQNAVVQDLNKRLEDMGETWRETKDAMGNLRIASKEALRVRGETARRIEERDFWKNEFEKEKTEKEQLQLQLEELRLELLKVREDKKIKNESVLIHNSNLIKKLQEEQHSKVILIDEILDQNSSFNRMASSKRKQILKEMRQHTVSDLEKLAMISEKRSSAAKLAESRAFKSPSKTAFV